MAGPSPILYTHIMAKVLTLDDTAVDVAELPRELLEAMAAVFP